MAGLETSGSNPDVRLLHSINGLARDAPHWVDRTVVFLGAYGLLLVLVLLLAGCWWAGRRGAGGPEAAASSAAAVIWAPLAALAAVGINVPIRDFVARPRPFADHEGLDVLVSCSSRHSFVSDHATLAMAVAAGLYVASRKFGLAAIAVALAEGFCRIYAGVQYPTDVIGGFALGTAVALLLSPLATLALTPLTRAVAGSARAGRLVYAPPPGPHDPAAGPRQDPGTPAVDGDRGDGDHDHAGAGRADGVRGDGVRGDGGRGDGGRAAGERTGRAHDGPVGHEPYAERGFEPTRFRAADAEAARARKAGTGPVVARTSCTDPAGTRRRPDSDGAQPPSAVPRAREAARPATPSQGRRARESRPGSGGRDAADHERRSAPVPQGRR